MLKKCLNIFFLIFLFFPFSGYSNTSFTWVENGVERKIYLNPTKYVVFPNSEKKGGKNLKVGQVPYMIDVTLEGSSKFLKSKGNTKVLPVFSDNPSGVGSYRSLPGGIFVRFSQDKTPEEIDDWYERRKLKYIKKLDIGKKAIWLIETLPGIKTLETMNLIKNDSEIEFMTPNWWLQDSKR